MMNRMMIPLSRRFLRHCAVLMVGATMVGVPHLAAQANGSRYTSGTAQARWWNVGQGGRLPASVDLDDPSGTIGILNASGPIDTAGHPFFEALGTNGRACVTCHQPGGAMSVSAAMIRERWRATSGKDPIFAAIDGSNCPNLPQDKEASHSLLLDRGLFRISLPWPPRNVDGTPKQTEFTIEVVRDPTGCNTDPTYGLKSANPSVSVFRRPRVAANLKYVTNGSAPFNIKTGDLTDIDPDTGRHVSMNLMADARAATLKLQAVDAALSHLQAKAAPTAAQLQRIVEFESQLYIAQSSDSRGGSLVEQNSPDGLGPQAMLRGRPGLGDNIYTPVFGLFDVWKDLSNSTGLSPTQREFRESVSRGSDIFMSRQFWIRDTANLTTFGLGNPIKRSCATCHNARLTGMDLAPGFVDLGTNNYPTWSEPAVYSQSAELPVFKITCAPSAPPHPFLGRVIYTTDPGRALISGKCIDVGSIVMQQFRGLAARAPYFANGSAKTLRELVDYYDRRFDMKLTEQEKRDLINFLSVL
jgi:hypothetical protein